MHGFDLYTIQLKIKCTIFKNSKSFTVVQLKMKELVYKCLKVYKPSYVRWKTRGSVLFLKSILRDFVKTVHFFNNPITIDISLETKSSSVRLTVNNNFTTPKKKYD